MLGARKRHHDSPPTARRHRAGSLLSVLTRSNWQLGAGATSVRIIFDRHTNQKVFSNLMGGHFQHFKSVFDGLIADSQAPHISLQLVLDAVVNIFPFAAAVIYLADFKNDELVCVAQVGSDAIGDSAGP